MPWCPKCKSEYISSITRCNECDMELVDELVETEEKLVLYSTENEEIAKKLVTFLAFQSNIEGEIISQSETEFQVFVKEKDIDESHVRLVTFLNALSDDQVLDEEAKQTMNNLRDIKSSTFVKKSVQYEDVKFSAISILFFSVVGFVLVLLNAIDVISLFTTLTMIILTILFLGFAIIGIVTVKKALELKAMIALEEEQISKVEEYLEKTFTNEFLAQLYQDSLTTEQNYFQSSLKLNDLVKEEFPDTSPQMIEYLVDEYFTDYLDQQ